MYDFDSFLNYPDKDAMREYENMTTEEIIGMFIMRFIVLLALIGILAIVCVIIRILNP